MAQWDADNASSRIRKAKSAKDASDEIYREAMQLTFPDRENFYSVAEGQKKAQYNWDSTPQVSVIRAANRLSTDFTPQFHDWLEIGLGPAARQMDDALFKDRVGRSKEEAKAELENTTAIVQAVFNGPGFPLASNQTYLDWHYGQGGMKVMPNDDMIGEPVLFEAMPLSHFYAIEGPNGRLDQWFFWHKKRPDVIKTEWKDAKLNKDLEKLIADKNEKPVRLCSVVYRDYDETKNPFRYEVFHLMGNKANRIVERRSRTSPFVTPRYSVLAGENRGRGPVLFAMPDIRTANKIVELTLRAVALAVSGVYTQTENGVTGALAIKPLSVITVRSNGGPNGPSLQRLDSPQRIDFGELVLDNLHHNIKKVIGDHSLPPESDPIRTATEFIKRSRELLADQGGGIGRLYAEFIIPAVQRVVDILESKQVLKTEGMIIDQFLIEVRMTSPAAKSEAMQEVENIVRFVELLMKLVGQEAAALEVNMERSVKRIADLMDIPMDIRNTEDERKVISKGMVQAAAARAEAGQPAQPQAPAQEANIAGEVNNAV